jgi:hypothetical protein
MEPHDDRFADLGILDACRSSDSRRSGVRLEFHIIRS